MSDTIQLVQHECANCGPKAACLFAPYQLKKKHKSYCLKCVAAKRKESIFPNPVPASADGYKFDRNYRKDQQ